MLKGYKAISHWSVRDVLTGFGAIPTDARAVRDRNRITGAGVTARLDFGLTMVAGLRDRAYAECCLSRCSWVMARIRSTRSHKHGDDQRSASAATLL